MCILVRACLYVCVADGRSHRFLDILRITVARQQIDINRLGVARIITFNPISFTTLLQSIRSKWTCRHTSFRWPPNKVCLGVGDFICYVETYKQQLSFHVAVKLSKVNTQDDWTTITHVRRRYHQSSRVHICKDSRSRLPRTFHRSGTGCYRTEEGLSALQTRTQLFTWDTKRMYILHLTSIDRFLSMITRITLWFNHFFPPHLYTLSLTHHNKCSAQANSD